MTAVTTWWTAQREAEAVPVLPDLVDVDDVVGLADGDLGGVRGERHGCDRVAVLPILTTHGTETGAGWMRGWGRPECWQVFLSHLGVHRFGGELVPPLALLVVQQDHPVRSAHGHLGVVRSPRQARQLSHLFLERTETTVMTAGWPQRRSRRHDSRKRFKLAKTLES